MRGWSQSLAKLLTYQAGGPYGVCCTATGQGGLPWGRRNAWAWHGSQGAAAAEARGRLPLRSHLGQQLRVRGGHDVVAAAAGQLLGQSPSAAPLGLQQQQRQRQKRVQGSNR